MFRIGREITAKVYRATVLEPDWTVGANALASAAVDRHQIAFTDLIAGAAVFQIGQEIDACAGIRTVR
jgi:hypothetical protein